MPSATRLHLKLFLLAVLAAPSARLWAQESVNTLPDVVEHAAITYPALARQARIQGRVCLRVTTNGHAVTDVGIEEGHPLLAQSAEQNVRTWKFVDHVPATFDVTFNFRFLDNTVTFLQQPGLVQIVESPEGGISSYTLPEKWNAQVRNAQGTIDTTFTLWTYSSFEPELDGYTTGPQGQDRTIREPHLDGDMLGFDATLDDKYGQRLKFSMIGRITGDKIKGVFLNYWGGQGTWTAERAVKTLSDASSTPSASVEETPITGSDVAYHEYVEYSRFAVDAGIQGTVQLQVTTNGYSVTKVDAQSGNPFLVRAAIGNLRTWRFTSHTPQTFDVVYDYQLLSSKEEFLKEPGVVEVDAIPPLVIADDSYPSTPPDIWRMQLTSSHGKMRSTLALGESYEMPDGYVTSDMVGFEGQKEKIRDGHQDGDMLGFDATVKGPNNRPLRVSVLGKRTGNKITGVFLDYSGTPGTWTAVRQPPHIKTAP